MSDLLPCPFCGGGAELCEAIHPDTWLVRCTVCQCKTVNYYTKAQASDIWNARTASTVTSHENKTGTQERKAPA
jgi:hypothetical protein